MKKSAWIALGVCAALAVVYFATRESRVRVGMKGLNLPKFENERADQIEISGPESVKLTKENGQWWVWLNDQKKAAANDEYVSGFLNSAKEVEAGFLVTERQDKQAEFGFSEGKPLKIKIWGSQKPIWQLTIGNPSDQGGRYVMAENSSNVFSAKGKFWQLMRSKAPDWRKRQFMPFRKDDLKSIQVKSDSQELAIIYNTEKKAWQLDPSVANVPKDYRFDQEKAARFVESLSGLSAIEFAADVSSVQGTQITATTQDGKKHQLVIGAKEGDKKIFVKLDGDEQAYEIAQYTRDQAVATLDSLRDLKLVQLEPEQIKSLRIHTEKGVTALEKTKNAWKVTEPKKLPDGFELATDLVTGELRRLQNLKASRIAKASGTSVLGKNTKGAMVEIEDQKGHKQRIQFGAKVQGSDKSTAADEVYVGGSVDKLLYVIDGHEVRHFEEGVELFRKKAPLNLDNLPPEMRQQLEEALKRHG